MIDDEAALQAGRRRKRRIPRSFKEITPTQAFNSRTFFYEMVWKFLIRGAGESCQKPDYPNLHESQLALTCIGHASFLAQFTNLNALIDPNFVDWLFWEKQVRKAASLQITLSILLPPSPLSPSDHTMVVMRGIAPKDCFGVDTDCLPLPDGIKSAKVVILVDRHIRERTERRRIRGR